MPGKSWPRGLRAVPGLLSCRPGLLSPRGRAMGTPAAQPHVGFFLREDPVRPHPALVEPGQAPRDTAWPGLGPIKSQPSRAGDCALQSPPWAGHCRGATPAGPGLRPAAWPWAAPGLSVSFLVDVEMSSGPAPFWVQGHEEDPDTPPGAVARIPDQGSPCHLEGLPQHPAGKALFWGG